MDFKRVIRVLYGIVFWKGMVRGDGMKVFYHPRLFRITIELFEYRIGPQAHLLGASAVISTVYDEQN